jgi:hypothetical protein
MHLPFCTAFVRFRFPINQKGVQSTLQTSAIPPAPDPWRGFAGKEKLAHCENRCFPLWDRFNIDPLRPHTDANNRENQP